MPKFIAPRDWDNNVSVFKPSTRNHSDTYLMWLSEMRQFVADYYKAFAVDGSKSYASWRRSFEAFVVRHASEDRSCYVSYSAPCVPRKLGNSM